MSLGPVQDGTIGSPPKPYDHKLVPGLLLAGRKARCYCDRPPVPSSTDLAFFEFRGEGSREATIRCGICRYDECVHDHAYHLTLVRGERGWQQFVERHGEHDFVPIGPWEFDSYYCGCRGWD